MSKNINRKKLYKLNDNRTYKIVLLLALYPDYYDEGWTYKGKYTLYKCREFKTWKHNRKRQYKEKKLKENIKPVPPDVKSQEWC